jgi:transcription initiation factor IIE alpha subunit
MCRATIMELKTEHAQEKSLAQQTEQGPNLVRRMLSMLYELVT